MQRRNNWIWASRVALGLGALVAGGTLSSCGDISYNKDNLQWLLEEAPRQEGVKFSEEEARQWVKAGYGPGAAGIKKRGGTVEEALALEAEGYEHSDIYDICGIITAEQSEQGEKHFSKEYIVQLCPEMSLEKAIAYKEIIRWYERNSCEDKNISADDLIEIGRAAPPDLVEKFYEAAKQAGVAITHTQIAAYARNKRSIEESLCWQKSGIEYIEDYVDGGFTLEDGKYLSSHGVDGATAAEWRSHGFDTREMVQLNGLIGPDTAAELHFEKGYPVKDIHTHFAMMQAYEEMTSD